MNENTGKTPRGTRSQILSEIEPRARKWRTLSEDEREEICERVLVAAMFDSRGAVSAGAAKVLLDRQEKTGAKGGSRRTAGSGPGLPDEFDDFERPEFRVGAKNAG